MIMTARSPSGPTSQPIASASPRSHRENPSYFPQQGAPPMNQDSQTLSNTLANTSAQGNSPAPASYQAGYSTSSPAPGHSQLTDPMFLSASATNRTGKFTEEWNGPQRGSSILVENNVPAASGANGTYQTQTPQPAYSATSGASAPPRPDMSRTSSYAPSIPDDAPISRKNTLKKKSSMRRNASLKRSSSRRSMKAGSVRSLALQSSSDPDEQHSAFYCPVPTTGSPTDLLATRFQGWRKILKDLITYFRDVQNHYDHRGKSLQKLSNSLNNIATPPGFLSSGGVDDALQILRSYNKQAIAESQKAREIEEDVILALTGLRSDLHLKIKEIKNLGGDFKNSVDKEMDATRRAVNNLQEILGQSELDSSITTGKQDPYLLRLTVDRQLERQLDEENYLHQAYLNLESSGRELEAIVVGEIQKSYNALASIMKRDADCAYNAIDELRLGPISMPKDHEWFAFIGRDEQFVDPQAPIRSAEHIHYPGRDHYACQEIRAGLLERKSKYLKSYTAGWYVLSPTHLHEFKSADKTGVPIMSLYLPEQKLGSHSADGASSNKFILKGRQTGSMHRGHTWVFRAESHDTMMAWYEDIKALTERTPQERSDFVRSHSRAGSRASRAASISSDGAVDDEDEEAFGASANDVNAMAPRSQLMQPGAYDNQPPRPNPGGRFPSDDLVVSPSRGLQQGPLSPSSVASSSGAFAGIQGGSNNPTAYTTDGGMPPTTVVTGFAPDRTRSPRPIGPGDYKSAMPPPTSYPSNIGYDPNTTPGTHNPMPNPHLTQDGLAPNQQYRTPSPSVNMGSAIGGSSLNAARPKSPENNMVNGASGSRFSYMSSDAGSVQGMPERPAIKAAAAVMGNGQAISPNGVAHDGSGKAGSSKDRYRSNDIEFAYTRRIPPGSKPLGWEKDERSIFGGLGALVYYAIPVDE
ncbi:hypothetical protein MKZ38_005693 [Zalerion maritima]|uniref:PH domain-containing protein n=1 Tax=Zalerion maritima TaxID=339359 RepID=A0AAD5RKF3_9PEZI|nr:hypothetical protein MKZ38_005693 [Zalerion maritima]